MKRWGIIYAICLFALPSSIQAQQATGKNYRIDRYEKIYLPMGSISFADRLVEFNVGHPPPNKKYRDSIQCLHEPDYTNYHTPNFVSLGCGGTLIVEFSDNGFMNLPGDDLYIFEVGPSKESAKIEISEDGINWIYAGTIAGGKSSIDLSDENIDKDIVFHFLKITDLKDLCRSISAGADIDAIGAINSVIRLTIEADVLFDVAKYDLKESSRKSIDSLAHTILKVDKATILIEGHTDSDGSDEMNMELSQNRCTSVKTRLLELLGNEKLYDYEIVAYGKRKPKVDNISDANKQINRRVEITVLPPKDYYDALIKN